MTKLTWTLSMALLGGAAADLATPAPSLICSDIPSRTVVYPTPSKAPSPLHFIRKQTSHPTSTGLCGGMLESISLLDGNGNEIIPILRNINTLDLVLHTEGTLLRVNTDEELDSVVITIDGDRFRDTTVPYILDAGKSLAGPGDHTIIVEGVNNNHVGCFRDLLSGRMFPTHIAHYNDGWNAIRCKTECGNRGFYAAGTQYGGECWCGTKEQLDNAKAQGWDREDSSCRQVCRSDPTQYCGAGAHNDVYLTEEIVVGEPCEVQITTTYDTEGAICEGVIPNVVLEHLETGAVIKRLEGENFLNLMDFSHGFALSASVVSEYVDEVVFSIGDDYSQTVSDPFKTDFDFTRVLAVPGEHEITIKGTAQNHVGCFRDLLAGRMFPNHIAHYNDGWNAIRCKTECGNRGYYAAGTQYGGECWCGTKENLDNAVAKGYSRAESNCRQQCRSDPSQFCGAGAHNDVYLTQDIDLGDSCSLTITTDYIADNKICEGMIPSISLIHSTNGDVIKPLQAGETILPILQYPDGVSIVANANPKFINGVKFSIGDESWEDADAPFSAPEEFARALSFPGTHEISVEPVLHNYIGCFQDSSNRIFPTHIAHYNDGWNAIRCKIGCGDRGFPYAGSQYGGECWCATTAQFEASQDKKRPESECSMACRSDSSQKCGAGWRNSVYSTLDIPVSAACTVEIKTVYPPDATCEGMVPSFSLVSAIDETEVVIADVKNGALFNASDWPNGVYVRANAHRFVPSVRFEVDGAELLDVTPPFEFRGVSAVLAQPGNHTIVMEVDATNYVGCYRDLLAGRMFPTHIAHYNDGWNAIKCKVECGNRGFPYAGSQYGGECWCGTDAQFQNAVDKGYSRPEGNCMQLCRSDSTQYCGAGAHNSVYRTAPVEVSPECRIQIETVYENESDECEGMIPSLALIDAGTDEVIEESLPLAGYVLAIEDYPDGVTLRANTVFAPSVQFSVIDDLKYSSDSTYPFVMSSVAENTDGSWDYDPSPYLALPGLHEISVRAVQPDYIGCFRDLLNGRMFPNHIAHYNAGWNALKCRDECGKQGYAYAGSQYGGECWCGTQEQLDAGRAAGYARGDESCNQRCRSDDSQYCGAGAHNSVYSTTPPGVLSEWCTTKITTVYEEPPSCAGLVSSLTLVDAGTHQSLRPLVDGMNIVLSETSGMLTVRAHVVGNLHKAVKGVLFDLDGIAKVDATAPFYLNGDYSGGTKFDPEPRMITPGHHTLTVYAQLLDGEYEDDVRKCSVDFFIESVDDGPCDGFLQSFSLINAESNGAVKVLSSHDEIDISVYPGGLTLRANTVTQNYQPIKFMITSPNGNSETTSLYFPHSPSDVTMVGNQVYDYTAADLLSLPGEYQIKAIALQTGYQGCFIDSSNRIFPNRLNGKYDVAECVNSCRDGGFPYAASQYKYECFCGTQENFDNAESKRTYDGDCSLPCDRNTLMTCGGGWRNSVYGTGEYELVGEWCEAELRVFVGDGEGTCPGSIGSFSVLVVGGGEVQTLDGFHFIMGGETYTFDMDQLPDSLSVRANVAEDVDEVRFYVNNSLTMIETTAPYVLGGKANFTDFIYKADAFGILGTHTIKATGVVNGVESAESCEFTIVVTKLPENVEDPDIPVYDPHSKIDFLLLAEHRCKPVYVDGTVQGNSFFFKTLGEITNTTYDENVTFTTTNYFTTEEDVGNLDFMTTVYQDAETGEIVCDMVADVAVGSLGGEYVGKCDSGNFTYFEIYGFDEFFTSDDDADTSDLADECKPPAGTTVGGVRKFTFAVPCDCTDLEDDSHDYGDEIPQGTLVANSWGDPHITTWDGAKMDCMGVGEFFMIKANLRDYEWHFGNNDYETHTIELQMRYEFMDAFFIRNRLVSFGKGFVLKEKKTIQAVIAEEPEGKPKIGDCPIDFYVDGERTDFLSGINEDDLIVHPAGSNVYVFLPKTGVLVKLHIRYVRQGADGSIYTCSMSLYGGMPLNNPSIYNVRGLWGSPDGIQANDFTDFDGAVVQRPGSHEQQYEYCRTNWCNRDPALSLFKYEEGKSHRDYMHCDAYEWLGDYDLDQLDDNSNYICNLLENADDIEQCQIDGLLGGFNQTLQAWLDIIDFNALQSGTVQAPGDAEDACCSSNFRDCHTGPLCNSIYTCNECVGREDPSDNLSDFKPFAWLTMGPFAEGTCEPQGGICQSDASCCSIRGVCINGICGRAEDDNGGRRRLEHAGFGEKAVPKSSRHATPYFRPMFK